MRSPAPIETRFFGHQGSYVAVLHGGPGARGSVHGLARDLATRFRVAEPLQRQGGGEPLTVQRHVEDLDAVLTAWAGEDRVALVGWSWGAMLALAYGAAHPARIRSIALIGCGTFDEDARARYRKAVADRLDGTFGERLRRIELEARAHAQPRDDELARKAEVFEELMSVAPLPSDGSAVEVDAKGHEESWDDMLARQADGTYPACFAHITAPVIMLHGDEDPHPGEATYETLARTLPQLEYRSWAACGHTPWRERHVREEFLQELTAWLTRRVVQEESEDGPG